MFKVGDKVVCVSGDGKYLEKGKIYTVTDVYSNGVSVNNNKINPWYTWRFRKLDREDKLKRILNV